jgi:hypothetical protein
MCSIVAFAQLSLSGFDGFLSHGTLQGEGFLQFIASRGAGVSIWFLQRLTFNSFLLFSFLSGII